MIVRKLVLSSIVILLSVSLFAQTKTAGIELQGAYEEALNMNITPIAAQTESYLAGMPFNIEEAFVQYQQNSDGRAIATWNVLSNAKFNIYIKAGDMKPVSDEGYKPPVHLSYILTFSYNLSFPNLEELNGAGSFWIRSGSNMDYGADSATTLISYFTPYLDGTAPPEGIAVNDTFYKIDLYNSPLFESGFTGFTGSVDGRVFFKFTDDASTALLGENTRDSYPSGNYTATVIFFVEHAE